MNINIDIAYYFITNLSVTLNISLNATEVKISYTENHCR